MSSAMKLDNILDLEEIRLDQIDYKRHNIEVKMDIEKRLNAKKKKVLYKSFDDQILRELYDDFGNGFSS
jgi:hypothetical protein